MGKLVRCISTDGTLTVMAADTTDIVNRAADIHQTSAVTSAALGRLLTAATHMGTAHKRSGSKKSAESRRGYG